MCGRYSIYEDMDTYLRQLELDLVIINGYDHEPINRYNVAPTTRVELIRPAEGGLRVDKVRWGWSPHWAKGKRPDPINARVETVATGKFFKQLWPSGRAVAPANGWFEWVKDENNPKKKQPYYIRLKSREPMFFAALAQVHTGIEPHEGDGFVIVTDASDAGMVDIHDRRPVVLSPGDARKWLELGLPAKRVLELTTHNRPVDDFEWYCVGREVGNVKNQGPGIIEPIQRR
ncbi:SOS response-associated peptidase family protein [Pseudomonas sp. LJDD11]|uniref:SOS response-associated peptidase n=1 Tax=Pseudomonas sp. LJDD11 TaxID=2931984 RepID=UPI00211C47BC|nr:SOS response-associated peptidase family protein [Pseudomonas sp. LJDD11]MCQ9423392.1 SOS response-associated peptidase family protein [Pseudomonas sp. LJDD11]